MIYRLLIFVSIAFRTRQTHCTFILDSTMNSMKFSRNLNAGTVESLPFWKLLKQEKDERLETESQHKFHFTTNGINEFYIFSKIICVMVHH